MRGDPRVRIAILDGPVDVAHPCFTGAKLEFPVTAPGGGARALGHGTHVASILLGQDDTDVVGIAPKCTGLVLPIFARSESDEPACSQLDLARAILLAIEHGAHIINISSGQLSASSLPDTLLEQAIRRAAQNNVLIVAAAGNDGCDCLHIPAGAESVLAVGAMDRAGRPLASSNWGGPYRTQGLLAPGQDVLVASPGGSVDRRTGTSYAAPHVAGLAAILVSMQMAAGCPPDTNLVRRVLLGTADPCPDVADPSCIRFLAGAVNFDKAVAANAEILEQQVENQKGDRMNKEFEWKQISPSSLEDSTLINAQESRIVEAALSGEGAASTFPASTAAGTLVQQAAQADLLTPSDCGCGCGGAKKEAAGGSGDCGCGCGGAKKKTQLVYALGKLGIDFGSEARRDALLQAMSLVPGDARTASDVTQGLLSYLDSAPYDAAAVIWTLNLDATPIYAIQPVGAFAADAYKRLREAIAAQISEGADLISVPGIVAGSARLQSGQVVPVIIPAMRGIYSWSTRPLVEHVLGVMPEAEPEAAAYRHVAAGLSNYLDRVYYDLRNLGITGEERALNYSATNAVQIASVIRTATSEALDLDRIMVRKSPICRPDSECFDVELSFFNPNNTNIANRVFRFTVDVSDVIPVTIGQERSWTRRV